MSKTFSFTKVPAELKKDDALIRGSIHTAIAKAERSNTSLIIKTKGEIKRLSASAMRRQLIHTK